MTSEWQVGGSCCKLPFQSRLLNDPVDYAADKSLPDQQLGVQCWRIATLDSMLIRAAGNMTVDINDTQTARCTTYVRKTWN